MTEWKSSDVVGARRWHTVMDNAVCDICKSLDGQEVEIGSPYTDPKTGAKYTLPAHDG